MNLNTYFQISVSVFSTLATVFLLALIVWAIILQIQLKKLIKKIDEILELAKSTAGDAKDFVERTIESIESFKASIFTFEFVRRIITEIATFFANRSATSSKNSNRKR